MSRAGAARLSIILGGVVLLEILCRTDIINRLTMIPPSEMLVSIWDMARSGKLAREALSSFRNVAIAFVLAVVFGTVFGVLLHRYPRARRVLDPLFGSYYAVPFFALYPLLVVIFGLNSIPLIVLGMMFSVVAVIVSTLNGIDRVPRVLLKVSRTFRMGSLSTATMVVIPSILPHLFTGVKLALAYSFVGVLAGEFILASSGIGHAIAFAYDAFDNKTMYGLIAFILIIVTLMNVGLQSVESHLLKGRTR